MRAQDKLAAYTSGGWRFIAPVEGLTVHVRSLSVDARYHGGAWELGQVRGDRLLVGGLQVVGGQAEAITDPSGGGNVDSEARTAIVAILGALRQHGLIAT